MKDESFAESLFAALITGDRRRARGLMQQSCDGGTPAESLAHDVFWPVLEEINTLYRKDQLSTLAHHYATRLLRSLVDQAQVHYTEQTPRGRSILMFCGASESDELAAQLVADLAEADGYEVHFGGGGIANDEILEEAGRHAPDILLMFSAAPSDAPNIRQLIDTIRTIGACAKTQFVVGGGVFNRADGLAEEIGADLWAKSPAELLEKLVGQSERRAGTDQRTVGRNRRTSRAA
ncbi:MAG: cobalamin-dependent protein [Phycisphaerales bacterium]|nr:cobalamin-dependent protein [Phycisphaerales bacterium]